MRSVVCAWKCRIQSWCQFQTCKSQAVLLALMEAAERLLQHGTCRLSGTDMLIPLVPQPPFFSGCPWAFKITAVQRGWSCFWVGSWPLWPSGSSSGWLLGCCRQGCLTASLAVVQICSAPNGLFISYNAAIVGRAGCHPFCAAVLKCSLFPLCSPNSFSPSCFSHV